MRAARGVDAASLPLSSGERTALLELARVAAHTSERVAAPLATFLAGLALADAPAAERGARLQSLVERLDCERAASAA